jgi:lipopolysaccharide transport system permease protein
VPSIFRAPVAVFTSYWRHRFLVLQMTRRDISGRYRGSLLGLVWSFVTPLVMLSVYTFLFGVVFKSRWAASPGESRLNFALLLFVGLIVHGLFAECLNRAPSLVLQHVNLVKRVVFPLEILPWMTLLTATFHAAVSLCIWLLFAAFSDLGVSPQAALLPLVFLPLLLLTLGCSWFLASIGVYLRDVGQTVGIFTTVVLFLSPVFYPISAVPPSLQFVIRLNPLTFIIEQARAILTTSAPIDFSGLALATAVSLAVASCGLWWFQRTRKGFADVL